MRLSIFYLLFFLSQGLSAQWIVKGKVIGADDGLPLPKVIILINGTDSATETDMDGKFTLTLPHKKTKITFRYLGYIPKTINPGFDQDMLIKLNPDCTHHHYHSSGIKIHAGLDLSNNALAGRIALPVIRSFKAITSNYEFSGLGGQQVHRAEAKVWDLAQNCDWDMNVSLAYKNYQISDSNFDFNSLLFAPHIGFDKTQWIVGFGRGVEQIGDMRIASNGFQLGLIREIPIRLNDWHYIPIKATVTKWESFWAIETSVDVSVWPVDIRLGYNRISDFHQFVLTAGFGIDQ